MTNYVEVKDKQLFFEGQTLTLRGLGLGTWLNIEHFMVGLPGPQSMILDSIDRVYGSGKGQDFLDMYVDNFIDEADFKFLKRLGVNFVRVPINYRLFMDDNTLQFKEFGFQKVKRLLDFCEKYHIFCMLDMHTAPGGQNPDWHSDNRTGVPQFWEFKALRNQLVTVWREIAHRFGQQYRYLLGYDLLNEPAMANWPTLNEYFSDVINKIREVDQNHAVIVESDHFAMDFSGLEDIVDNKLIISFHYYPTVWKQNLLDRNLDREERKREFDNGLEDVLKTMGNLNHPLICGEAGYDIDANDVDFSMELLDDTVELFENHHVSWCLWAYKDACFMGLTHPKTDSPWMKQVAKIHQQWTHYAEMAQAEKIVESISEQFDYHDKSLEYEAQFRVRGILYRYQQESIVIPLLKSMSFEEFVAKLSSFKFAQCDYYPEYATLMQKYTQRNVVFE
ncbi:glycosyl hydrolase family 5 [Levilactobacillus brevis]|uniref:glycoside hydrolase family 5 protein n=1 Tax=Levilactobacillus brevis TaxID=1580 RepID=UPI0011D487E9|nr:cellulase family glycosylhydrolase [Levilactobacillus brevis]MCT3567312.1 glycosyl hydrolase family 5 [Levilactobacillus brevis]TYB00156.1 glycoside hydrolase family 5 protein [Lactobacillus sp. SL9-6]